MSLLASLLTIFVSIHAPAGGATVMNASKVNQTTVSIHAPAGGATLLKDKFTPRYKFQSTLPRGERLPAFLRCLLPLMFQSTLPRGERHTGRDNINERAAFQSTLPRGERPLDIISGALRFSFNPRSRGGSDLCCIVSPLCRMVSIHAPAGGATHTFNGFIDGSFVSIHAPAGGATQAPWGVF